MIKEGFSIMIKKLISEGTLRGFNSSDYDGFAGAESLADGSSPRIYEEGDITILVSGDSYESATIVEIEHYDEDYGTDKYAIKSFKMTDNISRALAFANKVIKDIESGYSYEDIIDEYNLSSSQAR